MPITPVSISAKYTDLVNLTKEGPGPVKTGDVEHVFNEATKNKKDAKALEELLHFGGSQPSNLKEGRLYARLGLVDAVAKYMGEGMSLSAAIKEAKKIDKNALARQCKDGFVAPPLNLQQQIRLSGELEVLSPKPTSKPKTTKPKGSKVGSPEKLIEKVRGQLDNFKTFACTDALQFQKVIRRGANKEEILGRRTKLTPEQRLSDQQAQQSANVPHLKQSTVVALGKKVQESGAGCCSTFALAAAHLLTNGERDPDKLRPRVEVVAHHTDHGSTHCYVVVGREEGSTLEDPSTWGPNARIVDPWLASLGYECVFKVSNYPLGGAEPNEVRYDSHQPDPEVDEDDQSKRRMEALARMGLK